MLNTCQTHAKALLMLGTQSKTGSCLRVPAPLSVDAVVLQGLQQVDIPYPRTCS